MRKLGAIFIVTFIIGISTPPAYGGMFDRGPSKEKSARISKSAALMKAEQAFLKGNYEGVIMIYNEYGTRRNRIDDKLQYIVGRALLKLGRFSEARNRFSRILNDSDNDKLLDKAYIGLADSYCLEGDYKKAKSDYEKVIRYFPDSEDMHIVYYRLGECCSKLRDKAVSRKYYDKLIELYPHSLEAKLLLGEKTDFVTYSVQTGSFEKWSNAKKLCNELNNRGFETNIYTAIVGDERFYRVRVGQYDRLDDAEDMARTLRNRGYSVKIYP